MKKIKRDEKRLLRRTLSLHENLVKSTVRSYRILNVEQVSELIRMDFDLYTDNQTFHAENVDIVSVNDSINLLNEMILKPDHFKEYLKVKLIENHATTILDLQF